MKEYVFSLFDKVVCRFYFELCHYQIRKIGEFIAYSYNVEMSEVTWWIEEHPDKDEEDV